MTSRCWTLRREIFHCRRINALMCKVNHSILRKKYPTCFLYRRHINTIRLDTNLKILNPFRNTGSSENECCHMKFRCLSGDARKLPIIYLFTKEGCTLCDEAKVALTPYNHRFILKEVDITLPENKPWYDMYKYDIPVFHMFEDFLFEHRVDFDVLEKALKDFEEKRDRT